MLNFANPSPPPPRRSTPKIGTFYCQKNIAYFLTYDDAIRLGSRSGHEACPCKRTRQRFHTSRCSRHRLSRRRRSGLVQTDKGRSRSASRPRALCFPKLHPKLGALSPALDDLAQALARETGSHLQIDGARAANTLGLSTQVAAQSTWLTDGPSRRVVLGKRIVDLRHASPKHLIAPGSPAGTIVQALRHVGAYRAADVLQVAARTLSDGDKRLLCKSAAQAPAWMRATLLSIAGLGNEDGLK